MSHIFQPERRLRGCGHPVLILKGDVCPCEELRAELAESREKLAKIGINPPIITMKHKHWGDSYKCAVCKASFSSLEERRNTKRHYQHCELIPALEAAKGE